MCLPPRYPTLGDAGALLGALPRLGLGQSRSCCAAGLHAKYDYVLGTDIYNRDNGAGKESKSETLKCFQGLDSSQDGTCCHPN